MNILLCGCGALGSQIAMHLARPDREFVLVDDDKVEQSNIATSAYYDIHVGRPKVFPLANMLWHKNRCRGTAMNVTFNHNNFRRIMNMVDSSAWLIIDTFDNVDARIVTQNLYETRSSFHLLHAGVSADRTGEIIWNRDYVLPQVGVPRGQNPVCTHELGAPILRITAALCANIVEYWGQTGTMRSVVIASNWEVLG